MIFGRGAGNERRETMAVDLDGAESVVARIDMAVGELRMRGGASRLMDGDFVFDERLAPRVAYRVSDGRGDLRVEQSKSRVIGGLRMTRNRWEIALNDAVPLDLRVDMATGAARLDLASLSLAQLIVDRSVGDTTLDLGGDQPALRDARIEHATGGLRVDLNGSYGALESLSIDASTGDVSVDLTGAWTRDLDARIRMATGEVSLRLPRDVGVEVEARTSIGKVSSHGLTKDGRIYRNAAFGVTPRTLRVAVSASVGAIRLEAAE